MKMVQFGWVVLLASGVYLFSPAISLAQVPCGNIIAPQYWSDFYSTLETTPIENCNDPFSVTLDTQSPYTLKINGGIIHDGDTVEVAEGGTQDFVIEGYPLLTSVNHLFFLHDGDSYRFINTLPSVPEEADYRALAESFFPAGTDIEPYVATIVSGDYYLEDNDMQMQLYAFLDYVDQNFIPETPFLRAGTYTLVSNEYLLILSQENFFERLFSSIIPTAYAQVPSGYGINMFTLTFTITETPPAPEGISSILFLPGIQASRLYTNSSGSEEKLWEPFGNDDLRKLAMNNLGESVYDVYTKDVVDEIGGVAIGGDVYKGFLEFLQNLDGESGPIMRTFPYDWRHDVFDIVENGTKDDTGLMKNPIAIIEYLSTLSPTGKTTIIAHSNGGLLAKAIMLKLEEVGKSNLVDKVIFVASPHLGTPKALATILHGYGQQHLMGLVTDDSVARDVMKNMPGVYGLIPSEKYLTTVGEPLISFDDSSTTKMFRDAYGFAVSNTAEYTGFLNGAEGRSDAGDRVNEISTANSIMLGDALREHQEKLDNWTAPTGVSVFNVVGTGLPTPKAIEYKEFKDAHCYGGGVCLVEHKIEPVLSFTNYGDETVVSKSAMFLGIINYYVNLFSLGETIHANITESNTVQTLVNNILHGSSTEDISFVSDTEPTFDTSTDIYTIHSPARIYLRDAQGRITGRTAEGEVWKSEIPGSNYFEVGGVKYVIVSDDISYSVVIEGEGTGIYTHTLMTLQNETESIHHTYTASITPTMRIEYQKTGTTFSTITIDTNSDGTIDTEMTLDGKIIEKVVTYNDLNKAIDALAVLKAQKTMLRALTAQAEKLSLHREKKLNRVAETTILLVIQKSTEQFEKKGVITTIERQKIDKIINALIKQKN